MHATSHIQDRCATFEKKIVRKLIFIVLILISSCKEKTKTEQNDTLSKPEAQFELDKTDYSILTIEPKNGWIFKNGKLSDLSQSELIEAEKILKKVVEKSNETQKRNLKIHNEKYPENKWTETGFELDLNKFQRQYWPVINENGEKIVWINFFCSDNEPISTDNIVMVMDGGNCYFNIKINLTNKTYSELSINGYA